MDCTGVPYSQNTSNAAGDCVCLDNYVYDSTLKACIPKASSKSTAIGLGVGIGVGVPVLLGLITLGALLCAGASAAAAPVILVPMAATAAPAMIPVTATVMSAPIYPAATSLSTMPLKFVEPTLTTIPQQSIGNLQPQQVMKRTYIVRPQGYWFKMRSKRRSILYINTSLSR